jgi:hypothetical protein
VRAVPNPGSPQARGFDCTCDPFENDWGEGTPMFVGRLIDDVLHGVDEPVYVVARDCPLHTGLSPGHNWQRITP